MNKDLILKIDDSLKRGDLDSFRSILTNNQFSIVEAGYTFNLFCGKQYKILENSFIPAISIFAYTFPEYFFTHINRLCYTNSDKIVELINPELYLQYEGQYGAAIIQYLKLAYYHCKTGKTKESFLDEIESIQFSNHKILKVVEELNVLYNIEYQVSPKDIDLSIQLNKYSWDMLLYSLCVLIEKYNNIEATQPVIEAFINQKENGSFVGNMSDYVVFLSCIRGQRNREHISFVGKRLKAEDIKTSFEAIERLFDMQLKRHQIASLITQYCNENNLSVEENTEGEFEFRLIDLAKEHRRKLVDIKIQTESQYYDLITQEILNDNAPEFLSEEQVQFQTSYWKSFVFLENHGFVTSENGFDKAILLDGRSMPLEFPITYLQGIHSYSNKKFGYLKERCNSRNHLIRLFEILQFSLENNDSSGIPFHLETYEELVKDFNAHLREQIDNDQLKTGSWEQVVSSFVCDKSNDEEKFSLDKHTHILLDGKCFGFREVFMQKEPTYTLYNKLLTNSKDKEANQDTSHFVSSLGDLLIKNDYVVLNEEQRKKLDKECNVEFDVFAYKSGWLFLFEVKSTNFRKDINNTSLHVNRELMKASYQLDKQIDIAKSRPEVIAKYLGVTEEDIKNAQIVSAIVSTSFEADHQLIGAHLKISHFELLRILSNDRDKLFIAFLKTSFRFPEIALSSEVEALINCYQSSDCNVVLFFEKLMIAKGPSISPEMLNDTILGGHLWRFLVGIPARKRNEFYKIKNGELMNFNESIDSEKLNYNMHFVLKLLGVN